MSTNQIRQRRYTVTSFDEIAPTWNPEYMNFMIYQREKCPTTGTLHWQCYMEFMQPLTGVLALRIAEIKSGRFFASKGSSQSNIAYCSKEESCIGDKKMFGCPIRQGYRNDLITYQEELEEGWSVKDILLFHKGDAIRYVNMLCRTRAILLDMDEKENMLNDRQLYLMNRALRPIYNSTMTMEDIESSSTGLSEKDKDFMRDQASRSASWKPC